MSTEYKKVRPIALAKVLYALRQGETLTFSSAPHDMGLNFILTLVPLPPKVGIPDMELYYLCYAPSCTNSAYIWWDLDGAPSHEASELMQFLESQPYPEDRPDADGMLYVETEEWDEFCKAHPGFRCRKDEVVNYEED